jgi:AAA ATPase domain
MSVVEGLLERAIEGQGAVVGVVGSPGIGKSRLVREVAAMAAARGVEMFTTFCESHTSQIPFHGVAGLLRAVTGIKGLDPDAARAHVQAQVRDADPEDLALFDDLLSIAAPGHSRPKVDPDARRRRLTALVSAASLARKSPALYVVEDAHWIDEVSESMLAEFLTVIPQTRSLVLVTYGPGYEGALAGVHGAQTIALAPLNDSDNTALVSELLGHDPSVGKLAQKIADRAAGNPFFAEEIVRELAERGVLRGEPGAYLSAPDIDEVSVPATLEATIAARINRLDPKVARTLSAAAVIGSPFGRDLLEALSIDPALADLVSRELIDQTRVTGQREYVFHHPLIRTVAYEAQLKSDRSELHRRLAAAIETREPESAVQNAALIAEHLEAAGDLHAAYGWHMRAANRAARRDIAAARLSWERARKTAGALPTDDPNRAPMCIAPGTMLCGTAWRVNERVAGTRFYELQDLCAASGDKVSLAIATAGLVIDLAYHAQTREASQLASKAWAIAESIGDPTLMVALSSPLFYAKLQSARYSEALQWSQRIIDLADDDPVKGNFITGSPLAVALGTRAIAGWCLGRPGWRHDIQRAIATARSADPMSYVQVVDGIYFAAIPGGVVIPDDSTVREIENALRIAERCGDDLGLTFAQATLGVALVHRETPADSDHGQKLLAEASEMFLRRGNNLCDLPIVEVYSAREKARRGHGDDAITLMRAAVDDLFRYGILLGWSFPATGVLVETLLDRGTDADVAEAEAAIDRLARLPTDGPMVREIWIWRLRALLARARGDAAAFAHLRDRYRDTARTLDLEGHIAWAEAMS